MKHVQIRFELFYAVSVCIYVLSWLSIYSQLLKTQKYPPFGRSPPSSQFLQFLLCCLFFFLVLFGVWAFIAFPSDIYSFRSFTNFHRRWSCCCTTAVLLFVQCSSIRVRVIEWTKRKIVVMTALNIRFHWRVFRPFPTVSIILYFSPLKRPSIESSIQRFGCFSLY